MSRGCTARGTTSGRGCRRTSVPSQPALLLPWPLPRLQGVEGWGGGRVLCFTVSTWVGEHCKGRKSSRPQTRCGAPANSSVSLVCPHKARKLPEISERDGHTPTAAVEQQQGWWPRSPRPVNQATDTLLFWRRIVQSLDSAALKAGQGSRARGAAQGPAGGCPGGQDTAEPPGVSVSAVTGISEVSWKHE